MHDWSIISRAAGTIPLAITADTASPAVRSEVKSASSVRTARATGSSRTEMRVATPKLPSDPTNSPTRSGPHGSPPAAQLHHAPVRQRHLEGEHVRGRYAVLEAVRAARVFGHVAADRAGGLTRRVGRILQPVRRGGEGETDVDDPWLHHRQPVAGVDPEA